MSNLDPWEQINKRREQLGEGYLRTQMWIRWCVFSPLAFALSLIGYRLVGGWVAAIIIGIVALLLFTVRGHTREKPPSIFYRNEDLVLAVVVSLLAGTFGVLLRAESCGRRPARSYGSCDGQPTIHIPPV
jgi:hypothetical protein